MCGGIMHDLQDPIEPSRAALADPAPPPARHVSGFFAETVLSVHHWTRTLFSFTCTRDPAFRFRSGQFTMIGLLVDGKPLLRAYSMVGAHYDETLEFLSIKVPDGPLTSRLQHIVPGDTVLIGRKPVGTLLTDHLLPGRTLYMVATGTGLAPFMSLIRDPDSYDPFERLVLVHGCREVAELAYDQTIRHDLPAHELLGELVREKLHYYPTVTREAFHHQGRATDLIFSGRLPADLGLPPLDREHDRVMLCGSPGLLGDFGAWFSAGGWREGSHAERGQFVIEKAFVEK
jgi:ferredoxin--NADP+ reductase